MIRYTHLTWVIIKKIHFNIVHLITNGTWKLKLWEEDKQDQNKVNRLIKQRHST